MRAVVVGGGTMGAGIASVLARASYAVEVADARPELAERGVQRAADLIAEAQRRGQLDADGAGEACSHIALLEHLRAAAPRPDVLIEAVPERLELKREVLAAGETLEPALLATNTSAISIDELAHGLVRPDRFLGLHFFNPVPVMALVEVVVGAATADAARDAALALVERIGKSAVVVRDAPGFATSRLGVALGLEAIRMVEQGVAEPAAIDRAMELGYRHPIGPLRLTDLVGLDVRLDIARGLAAAYGPRFEPPALLVAMVDEGRLGKKSGRGFYDWTSSRAPEFSRRALDIAGSGLLGS